MHTDRQAGREALRDLMELSREPRFIPLAVLFLVTMLVTMADGIAALHFSITKGQQVAKKHKILAAFGIWYLISFIKRMATQGVGLCFLFAMMEMDDTSAFSAVSSAMFVYLAMLLVLETACFCVLYFWNQKLIKTRLSLA